MKSKYALTGLTWLAVSALATANEPYIDRVYEYVPAPGQFINTPSSAWEEGYNAGQVLDYANELLANTEPGMVLLSLGGFGGYIVTGFDHTVVNVDGEYDFKIYGNAVYSKRPTLTGKPGGSAEPGIVMVSADTNGNGLPDDEWYELAGSEYDNPASVRDYEVTYYRPSASGDPVHWTDNRNGEGYIPRSGVHAQSYYPEWYTDDRITFRGTRLPDNAVNEGTGGEDYWVLYSYDWGYADNHPNRTDMCKFKIDWAVDKEGQPVYLPGIDFIKVYTGLLQAVGDLGESSTEISGIEDLHPEAIMNSVQSDSETIGIVVINPFGRELRVAVSEVSGAVLYSAYGSTVGHYELSEGMNTIPVPELPAGLYTLVLKTGNEMHSYKLIKK